METTAITTYEEGGLIADLTTATQSFCSMVANTDKEKAALFKVMNNPEGRLKDMINMDIEVKDVYCEAVQCVNKETGELTTAPRIVLIDKDNKGYQCVSVGIYSALKKLFLIYGQPTWKTPITLTIKSINKGDRSILTFEVKK